MQDPCRINAAQATKDRIEKEKQLREANRKMRVACQNGGKRSAWKRFGRQVCKLERELYGISETAKWFEKREQHEAIESFDNEGGNPNV